jgi:hypothetical protein
MDSWQQSYSPAVTFWQVIVTSGLAGAVAAALFKWLSDSDESRRNFLSGVLTEAYKREAKVYEDLWKALYSLQEMSFDFFNTYRECTDPDLFMMGKVSREDLKAKAIKLVKSGGELRDVMDQNRPFFHRDVYIAVTSYIEYTKSKQWMRLTYPHLYDLERVLSGGKPLPVDVEEAVDEMMKRIDELSRQIRKRLTAPDETYISPWISSLVSPSWILRIKKSLQGEPRSMPSGQQAHQRRGQPPTE